MCMSVYIYECPYAFRDTPIIYGNIYMFFVTKVK